MAKTKEAVLRQLESDYEKACNAWVLEMARLWDMSGQRGEWIAGESGGIYDFNGEWTIDMRDIKYIVRNGITYDQVSDWQDYVEWAYDYEDYGCEIPTLREYVEYLVPLLDSEAQQRIAAKRREIDRMKDELARLCDAELAAARAQFVDRQNMARHVKD